MTFNYQGTEYELAESLRVSYMIQTKNNHKPYSEVFQELGNMPLEKQIQVLYIAFNIKNPGIASEQEFLNYCLDDSGMGLDSFSELIGNLVEALMYPGLSKEEREQKKAQREAEMHKTEPVATVAPVAEQ